MVTFNSNGGSTVASQSVLEGNKAIIPSNPTREGYNFSSWTSNGNKLEVGKKYLEASTTFKVNPSGYFSVTANSYVKDKNDKKIYGDSVIISEHEILPSVEITNEYQDPDYIEKTGNYYSYMFGIRIPDAYVYKAKPEKFTYVVKEQINGSNRQVGIFKLDEDFNISIKNNTVKILNLIYIHMTHLIMKFF